MQTFVLGEYKFTCNIGQNVIKITGDCGNLVRVSRFSLMRYDKNMFLMVTIAFYYRRQN